MPWITLNEALPRPTPITSGIKPNRWACQIEGESDDISDLTTCLNGAGPAAALKVGFVESVSVLTSYLWDGVDEASQVQALAEAALNDCIACLNMLNICGPMKIGTLYEFKADHTCVIQRFTHLKINIKKALEDRATPSAFQAVLKLATENQWLSDCLPVFYEEPTYYSIYKAVEAIRGHCGGETAMKKRAGLDGNKLLRIKTVADYHRHVQLPTRARPNPFYSIDDCVFAVTKALDVLVNSELGKT